MRGTDGVERLVNLCPDLRRRRAEVLEPERDLVRDPGHHDLVLRVLEDGRDRPDEVGRPGAARVEAADDDRPAEAAAVEVGHEPGERAQKRRLPAAGRAEHGDDLAVVDLDRDVLERGRARLRVGVRRAGRRPLEP